MIPKECKRLAEMDFFIAVGSKRPVQKKSIWHGYPSTLHLWWPTSGTYQEKHYCLEEDAMTRPTQIKEEKAPYHSD